MRLCLDLTKNPLNLYNSSEVVDNDHSFLQCINKLNNSKQLLEGFQISRAEDLNDECQTE